MRENRKPTSIYLDREIWYLTKSLALNLSKYKNYINPVDIVENALLKILKENKSKLNEDDIQMLENIKIERKI